MTISQVERGTVQIAQSIFKYIIIPSIIKPPTIKYSPSPPPKYPYKNKNTYVKPSYYNENVC